jgi:Arylsulfotransferase (ASST)
MKFDLRPLRARLILAACAALLSSCGGNDDTGPVPNYANPAVALRLTSVDAIGVGGAGLLTPDPAYADLQLRANLAGGTVQLRFSCVTCNIGVSAQGATVAANQYLTLSFPNLEAASDIPVTVTDNTSGAQATYTLRARTIDHAPYTVNVSNNPEAADLYLTPYDPQGYGASFAYVVTHDGRLKYYYRNPPQREVLDFKKTVLPGGATRYSFYDEEVQGIRVLDAGFATLAVVQALPFPDGNTYAVDFHDHVIVDDGHYIVGVRAAKTVNNIPSLPGQSLRVGGAGLQEIVNGVAVFNWLSTDHAELYACSVRNNNFAANSGVDYTHWDSLDVDTDGHWLASFRHLDAVLKVNRSDGSVAWILGGPCDQFGLSAAQTFSLQHDARRASDGRLTLFDNNSSGVASRVLAFNLDEAGRTLVTGNPALPGFAAYPGDLHKSVNLGSAQWLASGRVLVGWGEFIGAASDVSEFDAATGALSFQLTLHPSPYTYGYFSYRARKAP